MQGTNQERHTMAHHKRGMAGYEAKNFLWSVSDDNKVATITLNRPQRKNPLTFDSYAEIRDLFRGLVYATDIKTVVVTGAGGNFCSGGDVHEIIGPLTNMSMPELLDFTRMTGDLVKAMRACPQPVVAAVDRSEEHTSELQSLMRISYAVFCLQKKK